jgi:peptidoglycan/LPS O-acetylase OafA/YrhL
LKVLKRPAIYVVVVVLWLLTSFLAYWEIWTVRALIVRVATRYFMTQAGFSLIMANAKADPYGKVTAILMTIIAIVVIIFGFDYHFEYAGQSKSWKLFAWTFGFQLLILLVAYIFNP